MSSWLRPAGPGAAAALLLVALLAAPGSARAWNATGHRLVALVAWENVSEHVRARVLETLRRHPRFHEDFETYLRKHYGYALSSEENQRKLVFLGAAEWPDIVRKLPEGPEKRRYHHASWHYIDLPLFPSARDRSEFGRDLPVDPSTAWEPAWEADPDRLAGLDAVQAWKRALGILRSPSAEAAARSVALCWVFHLAGDAHQPLHAAALFQKRVLPSGDAGGNLIATGDDTSLHAYWDGLPGDDRRLRDLVRTVRGWHDDPELVGWARRAAADVSFESWVDESYELAWTDAYGQAILAAVAAFPGTAHWEQRVGPVDLPAGYRSAAERIARSRVMKAGYRLAAILRELYPAPPAEPDAGRPTPEGRVAP